MGQNVGDGREHGRKLVFFLGIQTQRLAPNARSVEYVLEEFLVEIVWPRMRDQLSMFWSSFWWK